MLYWMPIKKVSLRSERSLIQTIGRAARNAEGKVIMYADCVTPSMENAIRETERRRELQIKYNEEHDIVPKSSYEKVAEIFGNFYSQGRRKRKEKEKTLPQQNAS